MYFFIAKPEEGIIAVLFMGKFQVRKKTVYFKANLIKEQEKWAIAHFM